MEKSCDQTEYSSFEVKVLAFSHPFYILRVTLIVETIANVLDTSIWKHGHNMA